MVFAGWIKVCVFAQAHLAETLLRHTTGIDRPSKNDLLKIVLNENNSNFATNDSDSKKL